MILKIVSGGQTGVDQASLRFADEMGLELGGWCPNGGLDENMKDIREQYPSLVEATTANPDERTKLNIQDSDGTLIIVPSWPLPEKIKDGTLLTLQETKNLKKPYLIINLANAYQDINVVQEWTENYNIQILNIAGPRESSSPNIYQKTYEILFSMFNQMSPRISFN